MKRFHVHVAVRDLDASIRFYNALFGQSPLVMQPDYAKWQLDEPALNFAISARGLQPGIDHLGLETDNDAELAAIAARLQAAAQPGLAETGAHCCYALSNKYWSQDPQGVRWEGFHSLGQADDFGQAAAVTAASACCGPQTTTSSCCPPSTAGRCC